MNESRSQLSASTTPSGAGVTRTGVGKRTATSIALVDPCLFPRWKRVFRNGEIATRAAVRNEDRRSTFEQHVMVVPLGLGDAERAARDPVLRETRILSADNWDDWNRGMTCELAVNRAGRASQRILLRTLEPLADSDTRKGPQKPIRRLLPLRATAPESSRAHRISLRLPRRRAREPLTADALFLPAQRVDAVLESWSANDEIAWEHLLFQSTSGGLIVSGALPRAGSFPPSSIPLARLRFADGTEFLVECGLELPAAILGLRGGGSALAACVENGRVTVSAIEDGAVSASELLEPIARRLEPSAWRGTRDEKADARDRLGSDAERSGETTDADDADDAEDAGLRSERALRELGDWLRPVEPVISPFDDSTSSLDGESTGLSLTQRDERSRSEVKSRDWRRYLSFRRLFGRDRRMRRGETPESGDARSDPRSGRDLVRSRKALTQLVRTLSSDRWREGIAIALPLRAPGRGERGSTWVFTSLSLPDHDTDFSVDHDAKLARYTPLDVGPEVFRALEMLYQTTARRLIAAGEFRTAAHVLSYLLGRHGDAARALEQGRFLREAATVWYHLAALPRRAAAALERGALYDEAARLWMDAGEWRRAATAWERAASEEQADAAWRKHAMELRERGREIEGAKVVDEKLGDPRTALEILEAIVRSRRSEAPQAAELALDIAIRLGEPKRALQRIEETVREALDDARLAPRRHSILRALHWVDQLASWARDPIRRRFVPAETIARAASEALAAWAEGRSRLPQLVRSELDAAVRNTAASLGTALDDEWFERDVGNWIDELRAERRAATPAEPAREDPKRREGPLLERQPAPNELDKPFTPLKQSVERRLPFAPIVLHAAENAWFAGATHGEVVLLDRTLAEIGRFDLGSERPVTTIAAEDVDLYASAGPEVAHFILPTGTRSRPKRTLRPIQIERTLPGEVTALIFFPDATGLLRISPSAAHILHPQHLRPIQSLVDEPRVVVVSAAVNHQYIALLVGRGRASANAPIRYELRIFRRRIKSQRNEVRLVESFTIERWRVAALRFFHSDRDDLLVWGDEWLVYYPSRREDFSVHELSVGTDRGRVPLARVLPLTARGTVLIIYGDGTVEEIALESKQRSALLDAGATVQDPVVSAGRRGPPYETWIAHRSGRLRFLREES